MRVTDPAQGTRATVDHADYAGPIGQQQELLL